MTLTPTQVALWANEIQRVCLLEAGDDVEAGLVAAEYIVSTQSVPDGFAPNRLLSPISDPGPTDIYLAHDIHNRRAQGILNRSLQAIKGLSVAARDELSSALRSVVTGGGEKILKFIDKYRLQLARLLTTTQLAALLEGAQEVAAKVPTLATFPGAIPLPPTLEPNQAIALVERLEKVTGEERARAIYDLPTEQQTYAQQAVAAKEASPPIRPPTFTPPPPPAGSPEEVHFPVIEEAVKSLAEKNILTRDRYDALNAAARAKAFTVANVSAEETLTKIRDSLSENMKEGVNYETWREKVLDDVEQSTFLSDAHQECFLPGTVIEGAVLAASKVWYSGPAVEIETDSGNRLRVTIHHPILTPFGWKHAGIVKQGDYLIRYMEGTEPLNSSRLSSQGFTVDDQYAPSFIEDIFESILMQSAPELDCKRPVTSLDFHGDGSFAHGKVHCIRPNRNLIPDSNPKGLKLAHEVNFVHRGEAAPLRSAGPAVCLLDPLSKTSLSPARSILGGNYSSSDSVLPFLNTEAVPVRLMCFGKAANLDSSVFHATDKSPGGDVQLASKLVISLPSLVSTDRVRKVKWIRWTGHVFNLQTATGFIVSQGIISGNCVFRTNIQTALSDGQETVLSHPLVRSGFPYRARDAIHDDRVRKDHLALEKLGIQGTNIYRADDPVWQLFRVPWDYNDRCSDTPMTVRQAAERGITEAQEWLRTGAEPMQKAHVPMPPFRPPLGFQRAVASLPLSIQLSMQSAVDFYQFEPSPDASITHRDPGPPLPPEEYPRDNANRFLDKYTIVGAMKDAGVAAALRESLQEDQRWKLDHAIAHLQSGGTVHHPKEPPGLAINMSGLIVDQRWMEYTVFASIRKEWEGRQALRDERRVAADEAVRNMRSKGKELGESDAYLRTAGATEAEMRNLSRIRHLIDSGRREPESLGDLYEDTAEAIHRRIDASYESDPEVPVPEEPSSGASGEIKFSVEGEHSPDSTDPEINERLDLISGILVLLFGDDSVRVAKALKAEAVRDRKSKSTIGSISLAMDLNGIWHGPAPPAPTGWVQIQPGPRGGLRWVPTGSGYATGAPVPASSAFPPTAPNTGKYVQSHQARLTTATALHQDAMNTLSNGISLPPDFKNKLSKSLSVMNKQQLRTLHTALGGTAAIVGSQRQPWVHAIKSILSGQPQTTTTPPVPAPVPAPELGDPTSKSAQSPAASTSQATPIVADYPQTPDRAERDALARRHGVYDVPRADVDALVAAVRKHGPNNLASLIYVRQELGWDRQRTDKAIQRARIERALSLSAFEGHDRPSPEEMYRIKKAAIHEPDDPAAHLIWASIRPEWGKLT